MRFDELASHAGTQAAGIGRLAARPPLAEILDRHRRRALVSAWSTVAVVLLAVVGGALLTTRSEPAPPVSAPVTTTTPGTTTRSVIGRDACPVTVPGDTPFDPESDLPDLTLSFAGAVWYGTPELWTFVQEDGQVWEGLPADPDGRLTQKTFWWTEDYVASVEPVPPIGFHAEPVDGSAPAVEAEEVTSGGHPEMGVFIIAGFELPHTGCWRITAEYGDAVVRYVAWADGR